MQETMGFRVLLKDSSTCRQVELEFEPPNYRSWPICSTATTAGMSGCQVGPDPADESYTHQWGSIRKSAASAEFKLLVVVVVPTYWISAQ